MSAKLYVFSKAEELLAILEKDKPEACPFFNPRHKEELNGENTFTFDIPTDREQSYLIEAGCFVVFKDKDGDYQLFEIKLVEDVNNSYKLRSFYCENGSYELLDEWVEDYPMINTTPAVVLNRALQNTRWSVGTVSVTADGSTRLYRESVLSAINNKLLKSWTGELKFRVTLEGSKISGRYVDFLTMRGEDTGARFEHGTDITGSKRTIDITDLKTALYGFGKGEQIDEDSYGKRVSFASVEWSKASGKPFDKPLGQAWIGDATALSMWGRAGGTRHRFGEFEDKDEDSPETLLWKTYAELIRMSTPLISYDLTIADLSSNPDFSHKAFKLGDTITVIDRELNGLVVKSRIVAWEVDLDNPENTSVTLENKLPDFADSQLRLKQLEDLVHERQGIWDGDSTSDLIEYKFGTINALTAKTYFTHEYMVEPAIFFTIQNHNNNFIDIKFIKFVNEEGAEVIIGADLYFQADQVDKKFSLMILGGK